MVPRSDGPDEKPNQVTCRVGSGQDFGPPKRIGQESLSPMQSFISTLKLSEKRKDFFRRYLGDYDWRECFSHPKKCCWMPWRRLELFSVFWTCYTLLVKPTHFFRKPTRKKVGPDTGLIWMSHIHARFQMMISVLVTCYSGQSPTLMCDNVTGSALCRRNFLG